MSNQFAQLDAQSAESSFAQFTSEEHEECQNFLDSLKYSSFDPDDFRYPIEEDNAFFP